MKKLEVLRKYREDLIGSIVEHRKKVFESNGMVEFSIYIDDSGDITVLEDVQGGTSFYPETDSFHYVTTIAESPNCTWTCALDAGYDIPDDDTDRLDLFDSITEWMTDNVDAAAEYDDIVTSARIEDMLRLPEQWKGGV